jgi:hypothetical protein
MPPPEAGDLGPQAMVEYGQRQFDHYFTGKQPQAWRIAASREARVPLVCGLPQARLDELMHLARDHDVHIRRVAAWWSRPVESLLSRRDLGAASSVKGNGSSVIEAEHSAVDGGASHERDVPTYDTAVVAIEPGAYTTFIMRDGRIVRVWTSTGSWRAADERWSSRVAGCQPIIAIECRPAQDGSSVDAGLEAMLRGKLQPNNDRVKVLG